MTQVNRKKRKLGKQEKADSDSDYQPQEPPRKKSRNNKQTGKKAKAKPEKKRGLTKKAANEFKKKMNGFVKGLARMVNLDWHDGYEQQGEELQEYFQYLQQPAMCVYEYVIKQRDYAKLNEILKNMADSWDNIHAIPFRGGVELGDTEFDLQITETNMTKKFYASPATLISFLWSVMLYGVSGNENVEDEDIYRYIKDAVDNGADVLHGFDDEFNEEKEEESIIEQHECLKNGADRLKELFAKKEIWNALGSTKKKHKMRRCIDRRYDGALDLRTRDYHLYDDDSWF